MTRALKYDIPGNDWRIDPEAGRKQGWDAIFGADAVAPPLVVEIGFGRGEFLLDLATRAPRVAHVGVEVSFKRTLKMARRLARSELRNVRLVEGTAEHFLEAGLEDESVTRFWINFPDPWPKKRHAKRRLVQPEFVRLLSRRLVPGGEVHLATDHPAYAEWIDEILAAEPTLSNCNAPEPWRGAAEGRLPTAYELEWRALGRGFHFFHYTRAS